MTFRVRIDPVALRQIDEFAASFAITTRTSPLAYSRLVTSDQQNCLSPRVESKSHSPDPARCIKSKLLHVGMLRSRQRVHIGASEQRPVLCKNRGGRQQFVLNPLLESQKLLFEFIFKTDDPGHLH